MSVLAAGVVAVGAVAVLNLLLTFGAIRRLREHAEVLSERRAAGPPDLLVRVGEMPGGFAARTTDGERISRDTLAGGQLVGFFAPGCEPCEQKAPLFAQRAAAGSRDRALAVIVGGGPEDAARFANRFEPVARVVVEPSPEAGAVTGAFKVKGFPAMCVLDGDGVVTASGIDVVRPASQSSLAS